MPSFFTTSELEFFRQRLITRQAYRKVNETDVADGKRIVQSIYDPTNEWARQVAHQLPEYEVISDNRWLIGGGYFKKYSWARLFLRELGDQGVYLTVGVDGSSGNLVWKIDFQFGGDEPLPLAVQERLRAELKFADISWQQVRPTDVATYDWSRLIGETVAFMQHNEPLYRRLNDLVSTPIPPPGPSTRGGGNTTSAVPHPNLILYGPPGTGKTYSTVELAYEIMEGQKARTYDTAREVFQERMHDQVEFVTFHQSFTYEDFIQGIRPTIGDEGQMVFKLQNGIFYEVAQRARRNWERSQPGAASATNRKLPFEEVFASFIQPLADEIHPLTIGMQWPGFSFTMTRLNQDNIWFKKNGQAGGITYKQVLHTTFDNVKLGEKGGHNLNLATLKQYYEHGIGTGALGGLMSYYKPLVEVLLQHAATMPVAAQEPLKRYVLIIDEINRANISKVFGELLTLLEPDKRLGAPHALTVRLPSGEPGFSIPPNLHLIGTMNTADKSIALLDIALRRRFEFRALYPLYEINGVSIPNAAVLKALNEQIIQQKSRDFQIGHAYFLDEAPLPEIMDRKVIPLLYEYFLNDEKKIKSLLDKAAIGHDTDPVTGLICYKASPPAPVAATSYTPMTLNAQLLSN